VTGGGGLNGGEQLLAGVVKSDDSGHHSTSNLHREIEEANANSPEMNTEARTADGRRATFNGGRRTPMHGRVNN
jgi:hypothetical protein